MNKIEKEKLEWMSNLPKPNPVDIKVNYNMLDSFIQLKKLFFMEIFGAEYYL